ncbi:hypothetical protein Y032_0191g1293 [Ancylostoma ceylanicum]|uniref:Uncharacterized protein n=1 Tax=Ancylostoma ceylanicum TaxID=53326 RepID=A0A016SQH8_9BILA|nr:hypothetical protein Y032_0191g1293 [Ancylostoma ceylanicum]
MLFLMISSRPRYIVMVILIQCSSLSAVSLYLYLSPTRAGARASWSFYQYRLPVEWTIIACHGQHLLRKLGHGNTV